jgi:hypothetical protein
VVAGVGVPPAAGTCRSGVPPAAENTMTPSPQAPLMPGAASHNVTGGAPVRSTRRSFPSAKNPIEELSRDQTGERAVTNTFSGFRSR